MVGLYTSEAKPYPKRMRMTVYNEHQISVFDVLALADISVRPSDAFLCLELRVPVLEDKLINSLRGS